MGHHTPPLRNATYREPHARGSELGLTKHATALSVCSGVLHAHSSPTQRSALDCGHVGELQRRCLGNTDSLAAHRLLDVTAMLAALEPLARAEVLEAARAAVLAEHPDGEQLLRFLVACSLLPACAHTLWVADCSTVQAGMG
jgi:hypothetical protein